MDTIRTYLARAIVRVAIWAAPATTADRLSTATRPIWRPGA